MAFSIDVTNVQLHNVFIIIMLGWLIFIANFIDLGVTQKVHLVVFTGKSN